MAENQPQAAGKRSLVMPATYAGIVVILFLLPLMVKSAYMIHVFILTLIYIVATVSLRAIMISGQFPMAHAAFMGIGAYASAVPAIFLHWPIGLTIPMGGLVAMGIGALIGYPFARLRAVYYALVSLFFGIGVIQVIIVFQKWTQGSGGLVGIPPLLPVATKVPYYYFFLGYAIVCLLALWRLENCRIGLTFKAIAQSYLVAASVGINEVRYRVLALSLGCFFVGVTGATYAHYSLTISTSSFDLMATLWLYMYALIGGMGGFAGPIIGTALLIIVPELFRNLKQYVPFISAGILLIVFYVMPDGLAGLPRMVISRVTESRKKAGVTRAS